MGLLGFWIWMNDVDVIYYELWLLLIYQCILLLILTTLLIVLCLYAVGLVYMYPCFPVCCAAQVQQRSALFPREPLYYEGLQYHIWALLMV